MASTGSAGIPAGVLEFFTVFGQNCNSPAGMPALPVEAMLRTAQYHHPLVPASRVQRRASRALCLDTTGARSQGQAWVKPLLRMLISEGKGTLGGSSLWMPTPPAHGQGRVPHRLLAQVLAEPS